MESLKEIFETDDFQPVEERIDCEGSAIDSLLFYFCSVITLILDVFSFCYKKTKYIV